MSHLGPLRRWPHGYLIASPSGGASPPRAAGGDRSTLRPARKCRAGSYGWPLKPFDQQHPVRGFFGDPRIGEAADGHIEIEDVPLRHRHLRPGRHRRLCHGLGNRRLGAGAARDDRDPERRRPRPRVLAHRSGRPQRPARDGVPDDPRPHLQGLGPRAPRRARRRPLREPAATAARSRPTRTRRGRRSHVQLRARGKSARRLSSSRVGSTWSPRTWDVTRDGGPGEVGEQARHAGGRPLAHPERPGRSDPWRTAIDFTATIPPPSMFDAVFAPWTRQNHPWRAGRYRVLLRPALGQRVTLRRNGTHSRSRRSTIAATAVEARRCSLSRTDQFLTAPSCFRLRFAADAPPRPARPRPRCRPARRRGGPDVAPHDFSPKAKRLRIQAALPKPRARRRPAGPRGRPRRRLDRAARAPPLPRLPLERPPARSRRIWDGNYRIRLVDGFRVLATSPLRIDQTAPRADRTSTLATATGCRSRATTSALTTISPNGDKLRESAKIGFTLDEPAQVHFEVTRTLSSPTTIYELWANLKPGRHTFTWFPHWSIGARTYLIRLSTLGRRRQPPHLRRRQRPRGQQAQAPRSSACSASTRASRPRATSPRARPGSRSRPTPTSLTLQTFRAGRRGHAHAQRHADERRSRDQPVTIEWKRAPPPRDAQLRARPLADRRLLRQADRE